MMKWEKRSDRLQVAVVGERTFRIEKVGSSRGSIGSVTLTEHDKLHRPVRKSPMKNVPDAKTQAEEWLQEPAPTEPIRNRVSSGLSLSGSPSGKAMRR